MTKLDLLQSIIAPLEKGTWALGAPGGADKFVGSEEMIIKCDDGIIIAKYKMEGNNLLWFPAYFKPEAVKARLEYLLSSAQKEVMMIAAHLQDEAKRA